MAPTHRLIAAAAIGIAAFLAPASAQIMLTVANSGFESAVSSGFPTAAGNWQGDANSAVTAQNGVTPYAGIQMLSFTNNGIPDGTNGTGSDTLQLVDLSAYASSIAAGNFTVTLSAYLNRSGSNYNEFWTRILSFNTTMANFETELISTANQGQASNYTSLLSDSNPATWEFSSVSLTLPTDTTYIAVEVSLLHPGDNVPSISPGYYADNITLTAVPEPSTYAALLGAAALGFAALRRRFFA